MRKIIGSIIFCIALSNLSYAAHPLITDDTGTQGRGKMQFELTGEYGKDKEEGVSEIGYEMPTIPMFSYGITDSIDIVLGLPYVAIKSEGLTVEDFNGSEIAYNRVDSVRGIGDAAIEIKARVYDNNGFSLALKPGISLPTGNENRGLGNGRISYSTFIIASKEMEPLVFHFNIGYTRNEYKLQADKEANRKYVWHVSLASQVEIMKDFNIVANIGMERNPDIASNTSPAFALGGFIYSISDNLDVDMGVKVGLNKPETDRTFLAGIVWRL